MAIQREIWLAAIVEGLFASNSFMSKAFNADEYVNAGKTVHIPQAGRASIVVKNRKDKPASVSEREDADLTFVLDEFTTDPITIPHAETVELSYDKRESVLRQDKLALMDAVGKAMIEKWWPSENVVTVAGGEFGKADVLALMEAFNAADVPQEGRYLLVDAKMHASLLKSLTESESMAFLACADAAQGVLGKLFSFNVMMRSTVNPEAGKSGALAWHEQSVCRALGDVEIFDNERDPTYYGDVYSFLVRCGGAKKRADEAGVIAVVGGEAAGAAIVLDEPEGAAVVLDEPEEDEDGAEG